MNDNGELPPVLDLETNDGQGRDKVIARAKTWLDLVEAAFGRKPIIYSGQYFLQDYFSEAGGGPPTWERDYPLWLAQYPNTYMEGAQPYLPRGWFKWTFWQYSEKGRVNGINAKVDLNLFNGSLEDLYKLAGSEIVTEGTDTARKHTVIAGDSFESIAIKYGVTVRELVGANPQLLKTGDELTVRAAEAIPTENPGGQISTPRTDTVRSGENLTLRTRGGIRLGCSPSAIATSCAARRSIRTCCTRTPPPGTAASASWQFGVWSRSAC